MVSFLLQTQYYDLNYPATSLGASGVRDANLSVAYSTMTDGRFARTDNNSSPVSNVSTIYDCFVFQFLSMRSSLTIRDGHLYE